MLPARCVRDVYCRWVRRLARPARCRRTDARDDSHMAPGRVDPDVVDLHSRETAGDLRLTHEGIRHPVSETGQAPLARPPDANVQLVRHVVGAPGALDRLP